MKFKPGMRVKAIANQDGYQIKGLIGKVVCDHGNGRHFGIEFKAEEFDEGHNLDGSLEGIVNNGLWVEKGRLRPVNVTLENK